MVIKNESHYFYVCDGTVLKSIEDMLEKLIDISDESFACHVNSEKNDFASWTKSILRDAALAKRLSKADNKEEMIGLIEERIEEKRNKKRKSKKNVISQIREAILNEL